MQDSSLINDSMLLRAAVKPIVGPTIIDEILRHDGEISISMSLIDMLYDIVDEQRGGSAALLGGSTSTCQALFNVFQKHEKILDFNEPLWRRFKVQRGVKSVTMTMVWSVVCKYVHEAGGPLVSEYPGGYEWREAEVIYPMKLIYGIPDENGNLPWDSEVTKLPLRDLSSASE